MKNKRNKNLKEGHILSLTTHNSGITLIALVVTIVVLLILAGITISMIFSDNGVLKTVGDAANNLNQILENTLGELEQIEDEMTEDDWWRTNYTLEGKIPDNKAQIELYSIYYSEYSEEDAETEIPEIIQKKTYTITFPNGETTTIPGKDLGTFKYTYTATQNGLVTIKIVSTKETTLTVAVKGIIRKQVDDADEWYIYTYDENTNGYKVAVKDKTLTTYGKIKNKIDDLPITSLEKTFYQCTNMTSVDLEGLDTSNVTSMNQMFYGCKNLAELKFSDKFNTSNVTSMSRMFASCSNLTKLDVSNFNTENVTSMYYMFYGCKKMTELKLDKTKFNTKNVINMSYMFNGCNSLTKLDVSNFNTENVENMANIFSGCNSLTQLNVSNFDTSKVTSMKDMFSSCSSLTYLDVSGFNTSSVTSMYSMFGNCNKLTELKLDKTKFNTEKVTSMGLMFANCKSLTQLDLSGFDTSMVENMQQMFNSCDALTELDLSSFDTNNVTNMSLMFCNTGKLEKIYTDKDKWKTEQANTNNMFSYCPAIVITKE